MKTHKLLFILLFSCAFCFNKAHGQLYNFQTYSLEEGMAQSQILSICPDRRGDVWFGTYGGGACRFNGISFDYFATQNGLVHNSVWEIKQDNKGNIWFATDGGLSIYDGYNYYNYTDENGLPDNGINCMYHTTKGKVYIGSTNGLFLVEADFFTKDKDFKGTNLGKKDSLLSYYITSIAEDKNGGLWIGTKDSGVFLYSGGSVTKHFTNKTELLSNTINRVYVDSKQRIWVSTDMGITIIDGEKHYKINTINNRNLRNVEHVFEDDKGDFWISTLTNGLYKGSLKEFKHITSINGLGTDNIRNVNQDVSGCIWIGTDGGGAVKYQESPFIHYSTQQGLSNNLVMAIETTANGEVWFGTESGGVHVLKNNEVTDFNHPLLREEKGRISSIYEDRKGSVWIGTASNKMLHVQGEKVNVYDEKDGLVGGDINDFYEDESGTVWVATYNGVWQLKNGTIKRFQADKIAEQIWCIKKDEQGNLWFGTTGGLVKYDGEELHFFSKKEGLRNTIILSVDIAANGDVWIGTEEGIAHFDGKKFTNYTIEEGLTSNNVYFIFFDHHNHLFVGTEKGFDKLKIEGSKITAIDHYGSKEGFMGIECNANSFSIDDENNLWFGTIGGATKYTPSKEKTNKAPPLLRITNLQLFYENVVWDSLFEKVSPWSNLPINPEFNYKQNNLTFQYIGINMPNPQKVTYQFLLEGFDEKWSPVITDRQVTYSNLPSGDYVFKLKAANEDGIWTDNPIEYPFSIKAPFWETAPFIVGCALLLLFLIFLYNRWRTDKLRRDKLKLEKEVHQRTLELQQQKDELEKLSIVAQEIQQGVVIADSDGYIEWINPGLEKMSGYSLEKFKEMYGDNMVAISSLKNPKQTFDKIKKSGVGANYTVKHKNAHGNDVWASCYITPIQNDKGITTRFISLYSDVTKLKNAEREANQKNKDITDSIHYAKHIQEAILPDRKILYNAFPDSFILHKPKDIVSGDFYWFTDVGGVVVVCVADCTGHGVPGAFMSMIGNEFLHQVVKEKDITGPDQALTEMDLRIKRALSQSSAGKVLVKDGMDIALCAVHKKNWWMQFCGAHRPLLIVRKGEIIELKGQKYSIGGEDRKEKKFKQHALDLQEGDALYMFSDGFTDQFGGDKNKKFLIKRLKELLINIEGEPMPEQREILEQTIEKWKGNAPQVDDILVIGFRIG